MKRLLLLSFLVSFFYGAHAQQARRGTDAAQCTQNLTRAEDRYRSGILNDIPNLLGGCLRSGSFSKEETIRAYKLLTLVYIFNDNDKLAEENMVNLLKADPEHKYNQLLDPGEFIFLYNKFRTKPIFRIGVRGSFNISSANVISSYSSNTIDGEVKSYSSQNGFGLDLSVEKEVYKYFEAVASVGYHGKSFSYAQSEYGLEPVSGTSRGPNPVIENQSWLDTNVGIRALFPLDKFVPYAYAGAVINYLISTDETATRGAVSTSGIDLVATGNRNQLNYSMAAGLGIKLRVGVDFLGFEARYINGLSNLVNVRNRYPRPETYGGQPNPIDINRQDRLFSTGVVDDNFGLNSILLSVQYTKSFYNPKKIK